MPIKPEPGAKPSPGDVLADKYQIARVLGEGGMSTVYAAVNTLTGKQVAIKWLHPQLVANEEQIQRLMREAQLASSIDHPNVVNVYDLGRHDGAVFIVMELLHGTSMCELLAEGPQDPQDFVQIMMPVLRGVHAAHRVGVVHRDLKPDNIFMCCDPSGEAREPKVLDFGISKFTEPAPELSLGSLSTRFGTRRQLTREGTVFGTPHYTSPEQFRDARLSDARSDVYALGVIFYCALSGRYPYDDETIPALAIRVVEGKAPPLHKILPTLDPGLCAVVMRAMALRPEDRYESVAQFARELEPYGDGVQFSPSPSGRNSIILSRITPVSARTPAPVAVAARDAAARSADRTPSLASPAPGPGQTPRRATPVLQSDAGDLEWKDSRSSGLPPLAIPPPPPPLRASDPTVEIGLDELRAMQRRARRRRTWPAASLLLLLAAGAPSAWYAWKAGVRAAPPQALHGAAGALAPAPKPATFAGVSNVVVEPLLSANSEPPRGVQHDAAPVAVVSQQLDGAEPQVAAPEAPQTAVTPAAVARTAPATAPVAQPTPRPRWVPMRPQRPTWTRPASTRPAAAAEAPSSDTAPAVTEPVAPEPQPAAPSASAESAGSLLTQERNPYLHR